MEKQLPKPERPANDDCCGGGACCPCVWDFYHEQLQKWNEQQAKLEQTNSTAPNNATSP